MSRGKIAFAKMDVVHGFLPRDLSRILKIYNILQYERKFYNTIKGVFYILK